MNRLTPLGLTSLCLLHYTSLASFGLPKKLFLWLHGLNVMDS